MSTTSVSKTPRSIHSHSGGFGRSAQSESKSATAADYEHRYRKTISPFMGSRRVVGNQRPTTSPCVARSALGRATTRLPPVNGSLRVLKMVMGGAVDHGHCRNPTPALLHITDSKAWEGAGTTRGRTLGRLWEARMAVETGQEPQVWCGHHVLGVVLGMRKGEILALRWGDVGFESRQRYWSEGLLRESVRYGVRWERVDGDRGGRPEDPGVSTANNSHSGRGTSETFSYSRMASVTRCTAIRHMTTSIRA